MSIFKHEADGTMTAFQKYLKQKFSTINVDEITVERKVELAAALDKLLEEDNFDYIFDDDEFRFTFIAKYPDADFVPFNINFIVSPPHIIVSVCPVIRFADLSSGNIDAAREVVNEFKNELDTGLFEISQENELIYFAYTDWYGDSDDVPDERFLHYLLTMPMGIWLSYLNTILKASEGSVNIETAKKEILKIRESQNR